jgi:membrane protein implicated in regulation of membrane protease activity
MTSIFVTLGAWNWIVAGLLLLIIEVAAPGAFMMWLGIAALLVGAVSLMVDWSWQAQFVTFALLAVASIPLWRKFGRSVGRRSDRPFLNRRTAGFVGRSYPLEQPIVGGVGRLRIDDTLWQVRGPDAPAGSHIRVVAIEGTTLIVVGESE